MGICPAGMENSVGNPSVKECRYQEKGRSGCCGLSCFQMQPPVTGALAVRGGLAAPAPSYFVILDTTPAPTVRPPSRMAKRRPSSMAIGAISSTSNCRLSPGITISVPSGS